MGMAAGTALGTGTGGIKVAPGSETMVAACRRSRACAAGLFLRCRGFEGFGLAEMLGARITGAAERAPLCCSRAPLFAAVLAKIIPEGHFFLKHSGVS